MDWRDYQNNAAELLREMGFDTDVEEVLEGARGKHEIDVVARMQRDNQDEIPRQSG